MTVQVSDPFGVMADAKMPFLVSALGPKQAYSWLQEALAPVYGERCDLRLDAIRVARHKPGRRCLIEYDVVLEGPGARLAELTLIGKLRARAFDETSYRLSQSLCLRGFGADCNDNIMVPEPIGKIPEANMWLQRKVPGTVSTNLIPTREGVRLGQRIAEAINKLHSAPTMTRRRHTLADELRILHKRIEDVMQLRPQWSRRLRQVLRACERLGASIDTPRTCGIHRDFYPDQVLVNGRSLYLLDLDLYSEGDPALDIGNFIGHLTEQAMRRFNAPGALSAQENAIKERFLQLNADHRASTVNAYATLTLVRHIYISTQFSERQPYTEWLLDLCEQRLCKG